MAKSQRTARLVNSNWNQIATVVIPAQRATWPRSIVWNKRVFEKATTGYEQERYRERPAYFAPDIRVKRKVIKHVSGIVTP